VDIDPATRNLSVAALAAKLEQAAKRGALPDLLIPVDFAGLPCDLLEMRELADRWGFRILEDASHATGASYLGQPVGSAYAHATVFSFHAVKIVTTAEGGLITTHDAQLAKQLRLLRSHGMTRETADLQETPEGPWVYEQQTLGYNYRLTDLQAALGRSQLDRLEQMHAARVGLAERYDRLLAQAPLRLPPRQADRVSAWHLYAVEVDTIRCQATRADVFAAMRSRGVGVNVHYIPIHTQPYYRHLGFARGDFPLAEQYYASAISIPLFPAMTTSQQDAVVAALTQALESG
jgi:dTDP-4-amino-4,6-dideoxygalactose transaminase